MKKLSLVIAALAMVLGITQCKKQENPVGGKLITQEVTFTTSFGDGSKLYAHENEGTLSLKWEVGDKITVTDNAATPNVSTLECKSVSNYGLTGTFEGTITCIEGANLTFTVGNEPDYMDQHFTAINESEIYLVGESDFKQSGNYEVDAATKAQAQADIAEDGFYGVKQTSQRMFDFACALAGDDEEKMKKMQSAVQKGYEMAQATWGGALPDICQKTMDATNKLFDDYFASKENE